MNVEEFRRWEGNARRDLDQLVQAVRDITGAVDDVSGTDGTLVLSITDPVFTGHRSQRGVVLTYMRMGTTKFSKLTLTLRDPYQVIRYKVENSNGEGRRVTQEGTCTLAWPHDVKEFLIPPA